DRSKRPAPLGGPSFFDETRGPRLARALQGQGEPARPARGSAPRTLLDLDRSAARRERLRTVPLGGPGGLRAPLGAWRDRPRARAGPSLRVKPCVRPSHLEAVTHRVNVLRGEGLSAQRAPRTTCRAGHPLPPRDPKTGRRRCALCRWRKAVRYAIE